MNPRFAPSSEYLPAGTWNSKRPSSPLMTDCTLCRFLASAIVTRERASRPPVFALTTVPAIRYAPEGICVRAGLSGCAYAKQKSTKMLQHPDPKGRTSLAQRCSLANSYMKRTPALIARSRNHSLKSAATSRVPSVPQPSERPAPSHRRPAWLLDSDTRAPAAPDQTQEGDKHREPVPTKRNFRPDSPISRQTARCCPPEECSRYAPRPAHRKRYKKSSLPRHHLQGSTPAKAL